MVLDTEQVDCKQVAVAVPDTEQVAVVAAGCKQVAESLQELKDKRKAVDHQQEE